MIGNLLGGVPVLDVSDKETDYVRPEVFWFIENYAKEGRKNSIIVLARKYQSILVYPKIDDWMDVKSLQDECNIENGWRCDVVKMMTFNTSMRMRAYFYSMQ